MNIKDLLRDPFVMLDGGMGTMLQGKGMALGTIPETLNITRPDWIRDVHRSYIESGAQVIYANTFGCNRFKMAGTGYTVSELISAAIENARQAAEGTDTLVALDIGPIGQLLEPTGALTFEEAYDIFAEMVTAGKGADLIVIETMTDLYETKAAVLAAKELTDLPVLVTMTFEKNGRTFTGCSVPAMCLTLEGLGVDALGVNCSLGPADLLPIVEEIARWTSLPIIAKPNAGLPDPVTGAYNVLPEEFASVCRSFASLGVKVFGGCCGTTPDYIAHLKEALTSAQAAGEFISKPTARPMAICSATKTVVISEPRVIGERINPTGKKRFRQALQEGDMDYILSQAVQQVEAGADILDVNVGTPGIDEKAMMVRVVKALQSIVDVPLQIDSTKPEVIEAALRVYNGRALVNSVNGEKASLGAILPIVKKYGAAVLGLTLDENGIPSSAEGRYAIAEKILSRAEAAGIRREDLAIDCLAMTVSADQTSARTTLEAIRLVKEHLGLKTVLGVSNISFGLPNREIINHNFLTMALAAGLDLPIMNPNSDAMMGAVKAYKALTGLDVNSLDFIAWSADHTLAAAPAAKDKAAGRPMTVQSDFAPTAPLPRVLKAMETGMKNEGRAITADLLTSMEPMAIINDVLIPGLDAIGEKFEKGTLFLPQLILAADVAAQCFDVIKDHLTASGNAGAPKGKIILATVKGDIHDIGKNIVKVILENYGYQVIDLGKDVDPQRVVDTAIAEEVHLVGLSALMTTTLVSMEETIALLHANNVDCKIMVGGAVLTEDYAMKIKADYYAKDAKASADIAREVLG